VKRPIHVGKSVFRTSCLAYQPWATAAMTDDTLLPLPLTDRLLPTSFNHLHPLGTAVNS
jgi:hypothetical protein